MKEGEKEGEERFGERERDVPVVLTGTASDSENGHRCFE